MPEFVQIGSGKRITPVWVGKASAYSGARAIVEVGDLKKNGEPKVHPRTKAWIHPEDETCGIRLSPHFYVAVLPEREAKADAQREYIVRLRRELAEAHADLLKIYDAESAVSR